MKKIYLALFLCLSSFALFAANDSTNTQTNDQTQQDSSSNSSGTVGACEYPFC